MAYIALFYALNGVTEALPSEPLVVRKHYMLVRILILGTAEVQLGRLLTSQPHS